MTPEQAQYLREALASLGDRQVDALLPEFDALVAEHAAMKAQLHWRATSEIATDGWGGMVLVRGRGNDGQYWHDVCHIDDLHEGDEWMPVPT